MKAFAQAVPKMVTAGWNRFLGFAITGQDPARTGRLSISCSWP